jgi:hypothetical protein
MRNIMQFRFRDNDSLFEIETNYNPEIGDIVYYELQNTQENYTKIRKIINDNFELEGIVCEKWVNLSDNLIIWTVFLHESFKQ